MAEDEYDDAEFEDGDEYEDEYEDGEFEDDADGDFEDDGDAAFEDDGDADFDDGDGFDDDGDGGWGDEEINEYDTQAIIPIEKTKPDDDSDENFELDKDGNIITPKEKGLKRQKSLDQQCWTCSNCKAINKLSWTLTKFALKCCMCKQDTYTPTVKIFDSDIWDEPSNDFWECKHCTLLNPIGINDCEACRHPNKEYCEQVDDEDNGNGEFQKGEDSGDDDEDGMTGMMGGMRGGGGGMRGGMGPMMGGMRGMGGMEQMMAGMMGGRMGMMGGMGGRGRRRKPRDTRPFDGKKEKNLRNLLIVGFIRSCKAPQLPTKFFDYFNFYYQQFDKWDWDFFRSSWTSKKNEITTIKRGKRANAKWKNMYGKKHLKLDPRSKEFILPKKFAWKLRLWDRRQIISKKEDDDDESAQQDDNNNNNNNNNNTERNGKGKEKTAEKKESFEIQYMDVLVGVVNTEKLPNQEMSKSFNQYSCGYALFAGNGKIYKANEKEWIKVFRPIKHGDTVSINMEWMTIGKYKQLYATEKELEQEKQKKGANTSKDDDYCIALTFNKNDKYGRYPKGAAFQLPWSSPYKLAVSSAKKRWEIEWISADWIDEDIDTNKGKKISNDHDDDNKDPN